MTDYPISFEVQYKDIIPFVYQCKDNLVITLHIDDGCMGGGGSINEYKSKIKFPSSTSWREDMSNLLANGGFDGTRTTGNRGFHKLTRNDIFHYCFIADDEDDKSGKYPGAGETPGNVFLICIAHCDNNKETANTFMHELGHNILGLASHLNGEGHCKKSCAMYAYQTETNDYCNSCWGSINLPGAF